MKHANYFTVLWNYNKNVFKRRERHHKKHIDITYNEYNTVYDIKGKIIEGNIPKKQRKMVELDFCT